MQRDKQTILSGSNDIITGAYGGGNESGRPLDPVKITALYLLMGVLWIAVSDILLNKITGSNEPLITIGLLNDLLYVVATTFLLFFLLKKYVQALASSVRAGQLLRESEERFRTIFNESPMSMVLNDAGGNYADVNQCYLDFTGVAREDVIGRTAQELGSVPPAESERLRTLLRDNGRLDNEEIVTRGDKGELNTLLLSTRRISVSGKTFTISMLQDISDRKHNEELLARSEAKYRSLFENAPVGIFQSTPEGCFTSVNKTLAEMFGYASPAEAIHLITDIGSQVYAHPEQRRSIIGQVSPTATSVFDDVELLRKDGSPLFVTMYMRGCLNKAGDVAMLDGFVVDTTERKRARELIILSEKMSMIGGLAAGMAHEINNPLSIIMQSAQIIQQRLQQGNPANRDIARSVGVELDLVCEYMKRRELFDFMANIRRSGERAAKIVRNMLAFSRSGFPTRGPADINRVIDHAIEMASRDYDIKKQCNFGNVVIHRDYAKGLPEVTVDSSEMEQVVISLLKNAGHALAAGVTEPVIRVTTTREKDDLVIVVADNGPGMAESVRHRIFEPFFTTREVGDGMGLGLYVSYLIVTNNHKGRISVDSAPGKGAAFTVRLPLLE